MTHAPERLGDVGDAVRGGVVDDDASARLALQRVEAGGQRMRAVVGDDDGGDRGSFLRQVEPDVQLAQLLRRHLRRRAHEQVLGALVHREEHDLAQVLLAASSMTMRSTPGAMPPCGGAPYWKARYMPPNCSMITFSP